MTDIGVSAWLVYELFVLRDILVVRGLTGEQCI